MNKFIFIILLVLIPFVGFAETEMQYMAKMYYGVMAENKNNHVQSLFENGFCFDMNLQHDNFNFGLFHKSGLNFYTGRGLGDVGYIGNLNLDVSFKANKLFSPFFVSLNEWDMVSYINWLGYTGPGVHITAAKNKNCFLIVDVGGMFQYENLDKRFKNRDHVIYSFTHFIGAMIEYKFLDEICLKAMFKILPVFNFSEVRFLTEVGFTTKVFEKKTRKFFGDLIRGEYELKFRVDTFSLNQGKLNRTQYACLSGFKLHF